MSANLEFTLGLKNEEFLRGLSGADAAMMGSQNTAAAWGKGVEREFLSKREKVEVFRHSVEQIGGAFSPLASYASLFFDPLTAGLAAAFIGFELINKAIERDAGAMRHLFEEASGVEKAMREIIAARPTATQEWMEMLKVMGELSEKPSIGKLNLFADQSQDATKNQDQDDADAAQAKLELEQKTVEVRRQQGLISEQDAAKQIEAIKNRMVLDKNAAEQKRIKDERGGRQSDLDEINKLARQNPVQGSFEKKQQADATVNDLTKQIQDLPKQITASQQLQKDAEAGANKFHLDPHESGQMRDVASDAAQNTARMQAELAAAKDQLPGAVKKQTTANEGFSDAKGYQTRGTELTNQINSLNSQLSATKNRQSKLTPMELQKNHLDAVSALAGGTKGPGAGGLADLAKTMSKPGSASAGTSFEKMGFVMGGTTNYAAQQVDILKQIHTALLRQTNNGGSPAAPSTGPVNAV